MRTPAERIYVGSIPALTTTFYPEGFKSSSTSCSFSRPL